MNKPLISIIVPVYNAEKFLSKCIDSILNQSFIDWELLLIDDGSTDGSWEIIQNYTAKDQRIKPFQKVNGGAGSARNLGLEHSEGGWILFVDSDDTIDNNYIETLVNHSKNVDFVLCGMKLIKDGKVNYSKIYLFNNHKKKTLTVEELFQTLRLYALSGPVCKLFRREIIQQYHLLFPTDMNLGEDTVFVYKYFNYISVAYVLSDYHGYNVLLSNNNFSLTKSASPRDMIKAYKRIYETGDTICKSKKFYSNNLVDFCVDGILQSLNCHWKRPSLSVEERYNCYNFISDILTNQNSYKKLPFYFPFFRKTRLWKVYEFLNRIIYNQ